uniref:Uncharacterized protein n=1 Tax=Siphoviridae sp. ctoMB99 TaxID=2826459 RepID=A0A8S5N0H4_9CAUD|nr:MAG TPA: hypothetical protein [Siphoviridae sp. ctoMB99]
MIKIENTEVYGWKASIRGLRNPMNSWDKSDTLFDGNMFCMGDNDLKLMKCLAKAGSDHRKFLRMITVTVDITAPIYWWKEFDTYKVGTVANSCSTMHKIHAKEFTLDDFSHEHLTPAAIAALSTVVERLNFARKQFLKGRTDSDFGMPCAKDYWWDMIQLLPASYNQRRTVQLNYEVFANIYFARRNHKLDEWHTFCDWILKLPYFEEIMGLEDGKNAEKANDGNDNVL